MSFPKFRMIARMYLDQQQMRIACEHRIRKILEEIPGIEKIDYMKLIKDKKEKLLTELKEKLKVDDLTLELIAIMKTHRDNLYAEEKRLLKDFENVAEDTLIWKWSKNVKGLGPVGCMTFLGFINPDATSAGKIWKYFGYAPDSKLVKGQKANFNREAKGRAWVIATNVIRAGDPYYTALYKAKKKYYLKVRGMEKYIEDPTKCPDYEKCMELLRAKAKRLGRPVKKPPCRAHVDNRAKRWLIKLLLSHAWELIRREMGQEIPKHRNYIPPKPHEWWEEIASSEWFQRILRNIETGKLEEVEPPVTLEEIIGEP